MVHPYIRDILQRFLKNSCDMQKLTDKEEEIMAYFWDRGPLYVRQIIELMPEPKPHFNTVSTFVRLLEQKGFLTHEKTGASYIYKPLVSRDDYSASALTNVVKKYFSSSIFNVVSTLVRKEQLSDNQVRELIRLVETQNQNENQS